MNWNSKTRDQVYLRTNSYYLNPIYYEQPYFKFYFHLGISHVQKTKVLGSEGKRVKNDNEK